MFISEIGKGGRAQKTYKLVNKRIKRLDQQVFRYRYSARDQYDADESLDLRSDDLGLPEQIQRLKYFHRRKTGKFDFLLNNKIH